jgi:hypothetical protein
VQVWPTDTGSNYKDMGRLVSMTSKEITIEPGEADTIVRVHAPRHGFRISPYEEKI